MLKIDDLIVVFIRAALLLKDLDDESHGLPRITLFADGSGYLTLDRIDEHLVVKAGKALKSNRTDFTDNKIIEVSFWEGLLQK